MQVSKRRLGGDTAAATAVLNQKLLKLATVHVLRGLCTEFHPNMTISSTLLEKSVKTAFWRRLSGVLAKAKAARNKK